ncbi:MAG: polysaccharide deacetylase family protein [Candidatus Omnitrophota bacterium]|nr:MAG: polysaccharide deacetylase family protein [Candidatus Omnitrophota bacterium]
MYHALDEKKIDSHAVVSLETFRQQMEFIKDKGYQVLSLEDYCQLLEENKYVPRNLVIITFDDGYKNNLEAAKILNEFGFEATIFLIVDNIGKRGFLSKRDIRWILNNTNITIGSHTLTHSYLPELNERRVEKEIKISKEKLEKLLKVKITTFSYPIGGFDQRVLKEVESAGYSCACTTNRGFSKKLDLRALRRIKITERDNDFKLWAKLSGFYNIFKKVKNPY